MSTRFAPSQMNGRHSRLKAKQINALWPMYARGLRILRASSSKQQGTLACARAQATPRLRRTASLALLRQIALRIRVLQRQAQLRTSAGVARQKVAAPALAALGTQEVALRAAAAKVVAARAPMLAFPAAAQVVAARAHIWAAEPKGATLPRLRHRRVLRKDVARPRPPRPRLRLPRPRPPRPRLRLPGLRLPRKARARPRRKLAASTSSAGHALAGPEDT